MSVFDGAPIDVDELFSEKKTFNVLNLNPVDAKTYYINVEKKKPTPNCPLCYVEMTHTELVIFLF